jgi:hypothetical protein
VDIPTQKTQIILPENSSKVKSGVPQSAAMAGKKPELLFKNETEQLNLGGESALLKPVDR